MTLREAWIFGKERLTGANVPEADLDAWYLLEWCTGVSRSHYLAYPEEAISPEQEEQYREALVRRAQRIPLQQITGYQEFMGLRFKVTPDVLIPRQDTEILVEEVMRYLHDGMHILDMCTGSGCILLSLLKYSNDCEGTGCDISEKALKVAEENAEKLSLNASFVQSNLFENISGKYEFIVSNPPYIPTGVIPTLMEEVRDHEPVSALDGREDGLYFYREIVEKAGEYLYPGGMLFFEIGYDQAEKVSSLMREAGYQEVTVCKDLAGLDRVVYGTLL